MTDSSIAYHFLTSLETLSWAKEAVEEFNSECRDFFHNDPARRIIEFDEKTGENVHKINPTRRLPSSVARKATEAISHTKNAFDQALYAACIVVGGPPKGSIYFPWSESPIDLEHRLRGKKTSPPKIPVELWPIIRYFEPYPTGQAHTGGDDLVRELAKVANRKHTVRLTFTLHVVGFEYTNINAFAARGPLSILNPTWDPVNNEIVLVRASTETEIDYNCKIAIQITFNEPGLLAQKSVVDSLSNFLAKAQTVADRLQRECASIMGG
jgi:hypothetical protein